MKKISIFKRMIYTLFFIGTVITLFIVYKDIDSNMAFKFVLGYMFFTFFMLLYIPFITIVNLRKFKWIKIRKIFLKFISLFILFYILNCIFNYIFRPSNIDLFRDFSIALGTSFAISFSITLSKK